MSQTDVTIPKKAGWLKPLGFGLVLAVLAHLFTIGLIPSVIMNVAMKRIGEAAGGLNRISHNDMVTPQNQRIVRSSPDLAYSTCALDLSKGPVRIFLGKGADYMSAAFYAANTDNVFTLNDRKIGPKGAHIMVVSARTPLAAKPGEVVVSLPSDKGLLLVRRLSPSAEAFTRVQGERASDYCRAVPDPI
ncbi:hypothetical protein PbB2_01902 [Candidatus Phycosocius bacilliformis]|uniref:DUF1254 domain-containing protein n=1 Tax=Candidatus Phycosocius bacilliformis TaxID=1445552 RepID=A0A2P2EAZ1_9PROT|nr:DUF1254 domain-containing protein [Candidatus Phycosocius bacilliformis]GBF58230.1 hypothetical protein PbB2_01902 [Candidatus Phycosocius bacilliformis]